MAVVPLMPPLCDRVCEAAITDEMEAAEREDAAAADVEDIEAATESANVVSV